MTRTVRLMGLNFLLQVAQLLWPYGPMALWPYGPMGIQARTWKQELKRRPWRDAAYLLVPTALLLPYTAQNHPPMDGTALPGLPTSHTHIPIIIFKILPPTCLQVGLMEAIFFFSVEVPSPR